jgi:hypothetical protein
MALVAFWAFLMWIGTWLAGRVTGLLEPGRKQPFEEAIGIDHLADDTVALAKLKKLPTTLDF